MMTAARNVVLLINQEARENWLSYKNIMTVGAKITTMKGPSSLKALIRDYLRVHNFIVVRDRSNIVGPPGKKRTPQVKKITISAASYFFF